MVRNIELNDFRNNIAQMAANVGVFVTASKLFTTRWTKGSAWALARVDGVERCCIEPASTDAKTELAAHILSIESKLKSIPNFPEFQVVVKTHNYDRGPSDMYLQLKVAHTGVF